jgi:hypothetical protein
MFERDCLPLVLDELLNLVKTGRNQVNAPKLFQSPAVEKAEPLHLALHNS